ncbi:hypothetical protein [Prauserella muralis]|uniref:Uncharacterized protein n=1 Tax=Prauserella muralis TaxID=588067 RepID=A0A2V4B6C1_9PSEU|nr:hypothetical protein [Prauserella muralis]PXY30945.1 hypothetical protein BAY60_00470 [Prauserella muralis]TWE14800.1 hypothetical protein FHX69_6959 [Prauserella muralis]
METLAPILFVVVFAAIVGLVAWLFLRSRRREQTMRDEEVGGELARLAAGRGWIFEQENVGYADRFTGYPFSQHLRERRSRELVTGTHRGWEFGAFQYSPRPMQDPGERQQYFRYFRVFAIRLPAPRPTLQLTPKGAGEYKVNTDDDRFAAYVLTEPVKRWLAEDPRAPRYRVRFERDELIAWYEQKDRFAPAELDMGLDFLCDLLDRVPREALR